MKKKFLSKKSNGKYDVYEDCTVINLSSKTDSKQSNTKSYKRKKICNFYIKIFFINRAFNTNVSFTITLINTKGKSDTCTIPICYLYDPSGWLHLYFDTFDFQICVSKKSFDEHMVEILNIFSKNTTYEEVIMGWNTYDPTTKLPYSNAGFAKYDTPDKYIYDYYDDKKADKASDININKTLIDYIPLSDEHISIPLISYMLLSMLTSLEAFGPGRKPDFIMSLTGGTEHERSIAALFFTNLFYRYLDLNKKSYKHVHLFPDEPLSNVKFKAMFEKDCVLIAFEPDKKRCNFLYDIYANSIINKKCPVSSLCLITAENVKDIPFKTLNINITSPIDTELLRKTIYDDSLNGDNEPSFMLAIYKYIYLLKEKLSGSNTEFVHTEYNKFVNEFGESIIGRDASEDAAEIIKELSFAYYLYLNIIYKDDILKVKQLFLRAANIIRPVVRNSFPEKDEVTITDYEIAYDICASLNKYFSKQKNRSHIQKVGEMNDIEDVRMVYDDDYFYITVNNIKETLLICKNNNDFSLKIKRALYSMGLIHVYENNGKTEYSIHLQKYLQNNRISKKRYIAFDRKKCKQRKLFEDIESNILGDDIYSDFFDIGELTELITDTNLPQTNQCINPNFELSPDNMDKQIDYVRAYVHRFDPDFNAFEVQLSDQDLVSWSIFLSNIVKPIYEELHKVFLKSHIIHVDRISFKASPQSQMHRQKKAYIWGYTTGRYEWRKITLYDYTGTNFKVHNEQFLTGFEGYVHCNCYRGYGNIDGVEVVGCWNTIQEYIKNNLSQEANSSLRHSIYIYIVNIRSAEKIKGKEANIKDLHKARKSSRIEAEKIFDLCKKKRTSNDSAVTKVMSHIINHKDVLMRCFEDEKLELTNERAEDALKPITCLKEDRFFINNDENAKASAIMYSLIKTAQDNGLCADGYLIWIMENIHKLNNNDLLPWSKKIPDSIKM